MPPEEDRAKAIGNMYKKIGKDRTCTFGEIADRQKHTQTDRHAHHNTPLPYRGRRVTSSSCCRTNSKKPHRCCYLSNKVEISTARRIFLSVYFTMGQEMSPPNCPFPWGYLGHPRKTRFGVLTRVHIPNGSSICPAVFIELAVLTSRQTHRPR